MTTACLLAAAWVFLLISNCITSDPLSGADESTHKKLMPFGASLNDMIQANAQLPEDSSSEDSLTEEALRDSSAK